MKKYKYYFIECASDGTPINNIYRVDENGQSQFECSTTWVDSAVPGWYIKEMGFEIFHDISKKDVLEILNQFSTKQHRVISVWQNGENKRSFTYDMDCNPREAVKDAMNHIGRNSVPGVCLIAVEIADEDGTITDSAFQNNKLI